MMTFCAVMGTGQGFEEMEGRLEKTVGEYFGGKLKPAHLALHTHFNIIWIY